MSDDSGPSARWVIAGRVQGVGFRWFVLKRAEELGLSGWVRNLPDGRVEAVASGPRELLDRLDGMLRQGPRFSRVDNVERADDQHQGIARKGFDII